MTPKKIRGKSTSSGNIWSILAFLVSLVALPTYIIYATTGTPDIYIKTYAITNNITGEFYIEACNNSDSSVAWSGSVGFSSELQFNQKGSQNELEIKIEYPIQNTPPNPGCSIIQGILPVYGEVEVKPRCKNEAILTWCGRSNNRGVTLNRKKRNILLVDASAQEYEKAGTGEIYDTINTDGLYNSFIGLNLSTLTTQAPGESKDYRNGVYRNPGKRAVIFGDITDEEKLFLAKILQNNVPQLINEPRFESYNELINTTPMTDVSLFLETVSDCGYKAGDRDNLCYYNDDSFQKLSKNKTSYLYSKQLISNNEDAITIFIPTTQDSVLTK